MLSSRLTAGQFGPLNTLTLIAPKWPESGEYEDVSQRRAHAWIMRA